MFLIWIKWCCFIPLHCNYFWKVQEKYILVWYQLIQGFFVELKIKDFLKNKNRALGLMPRGRTMVDHWFGCESN